MIEECFYNPDTDLMPVEDSLALDISSCLESGVVLNTGVISPDNGLSDVHSIAGRVRDVFEVIDAQRSIFASSKEPSAAAPNPSPKSPSPAGPSESSTEVPA